MTPQQWVEKRVRKFRTPSSFNEENLRLLTTAQAALEQNNPTILHAMTAFLCVCPEAGETGELSKAKKPEGNKILTALGDTDPTDTSEENLEHIQVLFTHALNLVLKTRQKLTPAA